MLAIEAVSYRGQPVGECLRADFSEGGGTIGRGTNSTLVLPDPDRHISRTQATIAFQAGGFVVTDTGTLNPLVVNGRALGNGTQAKLKDGDELVVGGYLLRVSLADQPTAARSAESAPASAGSAGAPKDDPLALFGEDGNGAGAFDNLFAPTPVAPVAGAGKPPKPIAPASHEGMIPSDFDPFGTTPKPVRERGHDPLGIGSDGADPQVSLTSEKSIDDLFGLTPESRAEPFLGEDLLRDEPSRHIGGSSGDPLADLMHSAAKSQPSVPDHELEIHARYEPPPPLSEPKAPVVGMSAGPVAAAGSPILSWDAETSARVSMSPQARPPAVPPPASPQPAVVPPPAPHSAASHAELLQAFLRGAGVTDVQFPNGLTPELMEMIGRLLRESVQGTLDLLAARAKIKTEIRAAATVIIARNNNPLKFSPTVESGLAHLLEPKGQGFMTPLRALRDAYNDLRAHQFGVLAGMKAALAGVLARFEPQRLEGQLKARSMLDSVMPANRKAKQWDAFRELYQQISADAEEDFEIVFNKEFRRAYEAQMTRFDAAGDNQPRRGS